MYAFCWSFSSATFAFRSGGFIPSQQLAAGTFLNGRRKNYVEAHVEFSCKVMERTGVPLMYHLRKTVCQFIYLTFLEVWWVGVVVQQ